MKKLTIPVLVLALLLSLLTGCAGGKTPETAEEPAPETVEATEAPRPTTPGPTTRTLPIRRCRSRSCVWAGPLIPTPSSPRSTAAT